MILTQHYLACLSHASYLVGDEKTGRAVASVLVAGGFADVSDLLGGFSAWIAAGCPVVGAGGEAPGAGSTDFG